MKRRFLEACVLLCLIPIALVGTYVAATVLAERPNWYAIALLIGLLLLRWGFAWMLALDDRLTSVEAGLKALREEVSDNR